MSIRKATLVLCWLLPAAMLICVGAAPAKTDWNEAGPMAISNRPKTVNETERMCCLD